MSVATTGRRSRFSENYDPRGRHKKAPVMGQMNVTPFIDVLLVLLIMLILAIPSPVHQTTVDLPPPTPKPIYPIRDQNTVFITAQDALLWNGSPVTPTQLRAQVTAASAMDTKPILRFEPSAYASYDRSARTITLIKESGADGFAFVGNAKHKDFGR